MEIERKKVVKNKYDMKEAIAILTGCKKLYKKIKIQRPKYPPEDTQVIRLLDSYIFTYEGKEIISAACEGYLGQEPNSNCL